MPMEDWQAVSAFDFRQEFAAGSSPDEAASKSEQILVAGTEQENKSSLLPHPQLLAAARAPRGLSAALVSCSICGCQRGRRAP